MSNFSVELFRRPTKTGRRNSTHELQLVEDLCCRSLSKHDDDPSYYSYAFCNRLSKVTGRSNVTSLGRTVLWFVSIIRTVGSYTERDKRTPTSLSLLLTVPIRKIRKRVQPGDLYLFSGNTINTHICQRFKEDGRPIRKSPQFTCTIIKDSLLKVRLRKGFLVLQNFSSIVVIVYGLFPRIEFGFTVYLICSYSNVDESKTLNIRYFLTNILLTKDLLCPDFTNKTSLKGPLRDTLLSG